MSIGLEGVYYLACDAELHVKPPADRALQVRIDRVFADEEPNIHEIRYVANIAGKYDLRDFLLRADGAPLDDIEPAIAVVRNLLPSDHDGILSKLPQPEMFQPWRYRLLLVLFATVWLVPVVWYLLARLTAHQRYEHAADTDSIPDSWQPGR